MSSPPRFALLHATFHRADSPVEVRDAWLSAAAEPDRVEYIFAMDGDDASSLRHTLGYSRVVGEPMIGEVTAVRNWNGAAAASSADVLVVVADDLYPAPGWDAALNAVIGPLDPRTQSFAVKVADGPRDDDDMQMRHPVVSRAFYETLGLFAPEFRGVYCDDDISYRAFWKSLIIDGRSVAFDHRHAHLEDWNALSASQARINAQEEFARGAAIFESLWSRRQRRVSVRAIPPGAIRSGSSAQLTRLRLGQLTRANLESTFKVVRTAASLVDSPRRMVDRVVERLSSRA